MRIEVSANEALHRARPVQHYVPALLNASRRSRRFV